MGERTRQQQTAEGAYSRSVEAWKNKQDQARALSQEVRQGKEFTATERERNRNFIQDQFTTFGSKAFGSLSTAERRELETSAGLPTGYLDTQARTLKETEAEKKNGSEFKFISPDKYTQGGYFDPTTGAFVPLEGINAPAGPEGTVPEDFDSVTNSVITNMLQRGVPWDQAFNRVKALFPNMPNETIDRALGGSYDPATGTTTGWARPGAYEEYARRQQNFRGSVDPFADLLSDTGSPVAAPVSTAPIVGGTSDEFDLGLSPAEIEAMRQLRNR